MQQKNETFRVSDPHKPKRNKPDRKVTQTPERRDLHTNKNSAEGKFRGSNRDSTRKDSTISTIKSPGPKKNPDSSFPKKKSYQRFEYEDDHIFWCRKCNLPLIGEECGRCGSKGEIIHLSQPADIRFCSPYEREVLNRQLFSAFGCNPLVDRLILLNKIPGEDKTDEVLVDGFIFGILRFELSKMGYSFEPSLQGAKILLKHSEGRKVKLKKTNRHLNGKNVTAELVESFDDNIKAGDFVLVTAGNLTGYGVSYINGEDFSSLKNLSETENQTEVQTEGQFEPKVSPETELEPSLDAGIKALRIRKVDSSEASLHPENPDIGACIEANKKHLQVLGKNAINTIRGIISRNEYRHLPVYVSFSGGKDSLVGLDLARSSLKQRELKAFFLNTGIEFPETVEFVRSFCREMEIPLEEINAGSAFWEHVGKFGPPAKDFRWCCKVCKLASAGDLEAGKVICPLPDKGEDNSVAYLTIDGKRKHESFLKGKDCCK